MSYKGNIGFLYTRIYFSQPEVIRDKDNRVSVEFRGIDKHNNSLKNLDVENLLSLVPPPAGNPAHTFTLKTTYPGLLTGSGIMHGIKQDNALKLGFAFDHTTGLPYIPGSTVKGVLRNAFTIDDGNYVKQLIQTLFPDAGTTVNLQTLIQEIFAPEDTPLNQRDVFLDAFPVAALHGSLLGDDYITPHLNPLKNPTPISFLKVMPGVVFRFEFDLKDGTLTAGQKLKLFKHLLLTLGIGAKTNVGYGQLEEATYNPPRSRPVVRQPAPYREKLPGERGILLKDQQLTAKVMDIVNDYYWFTFTIDDETYQVRKKKANVEKRTGRALEVDEEVIIKINKEYEPGAALNYIVKLKG